MLIIENVHLVIITCHEMFVTCILTYLLQFVHMAEPTNWTLDLVLSLKSKNLLVER